MSDQQMNEMPTPEPVEGTQPVQSGAVLPGAMLAAQRQKRGWSVEQVASLVKLAPRQIQAIEADNYAALPGLAVARGFVRSYAKVLGLDANALTAAMPQDSPVAQRDHIVPHHSLSTPFSEGPLPAMMMSSRGNTSPMTVVAGILLVALVAGAASVRWTDLGENLPQLAWLKAHGETPATESPEAAASTDANATETPVNARVESISPASADDAAKPVVKADAEPASSTSAAVQSAPPAESRTAAPVVAAPPVVMAVPAAGATPATPAASQANVPGGLNIVNSKDLLRLSFREDSWIEIRRADKSTIISRLLKAGTTEAFDVSDAATLTVGNAAGVDATLRGQPLDLRTASGSNVARLNLN